MRERLFRAFHPTEQGKNIIKINGKAIRGEWIEGKNVFIDDKNEKAEMLFGYTNYRIAYEVIPETICEYVGLTDKNGNKIFEGSIVRYSDEDLFLYPEETTEFIGDIVFECGSFGIGSKHKLPLSLDHWCDNDNFVSLWEIYWNLNCTGKELSMLEVIGNIYENPELLK